MDAISIAVERERLICLWSVELLVKECATGRRHVLEEPWD